MSGWKNLLLSKTVLAALVGLAAALSGIELEEDVKKTVAENLSNIIASVSLLAAIWGRYVAKKQLSFKVKSKE